MNVMSPRKQEATQQESKLQKKKARKKRESSFVVGF